MFFLNKIKFRSKKTENEPNNEFNSESKGIASAGSLDKVAKHAQRYYSIGAQPTLLEALEEHYGLLTPKHQKNFQHRLQLHSYLAKNIDKIPLIEQMFWHYGQNNQKQFLCGPTKAVVIPKTKKTRKKQSTASHLSQSAHDRIYNKILNQVNQKNMQSTKDVRIANSPLRKINQKWLYQNIFFRVVRTGFDWLRFTWLDIKHGWNRALDHKNYRLPAFRMAWVGIPVILIFIGLLSFNNPTIPNPADKAFAWMGSVFKDFRSKGEMAYLVQNFDFVGKVQKGDLVLDSASLEHLHGISSAKIFGSETQEVFETGLGAMARFVVCGGIEIVLSSQSKLRIDCSQNDQGDARKTFQLLAGTGYFTVPRQKKEDTILFLHDQYSFQVLGTQFMIQEIRQKNNNVINRIVLNHGSLRVSFPNTAKSPFILNAGTVLDIAKKQGNIRITQKAMGSDGKNQFDLLRSIDQVEKYLVRFYQDKNMAMIKHIPSETYNAAIGEPKELHSMLDRLALVSTDIVSEAVSIQEGFPNRENRDRNRNQNSNINLNKSMGDNANETRKKNTNQNIIIEKNSHKKGTSAADRSKTKNTRLNQSGNEVPRAKANKTDKFVPNSPNNSSDNTIDNGPSKEKNTRRTTYPPQSPLKDTKKDTKMKRNQQEDHRPAHTKKTPGMDDANKNTNSSTQSQNNAKKPYSPGKKKVNNTTPRILQD